MIRQPVSLRHRSLARRSQAARSDHSGPENAITFASRTKYEKRTVQP
jgi:MOSC domain-containing protein YiiM